MTHCVFYASLLHTLEDLVLQQPRQARSKALALVPRFLHSRLAIVQKLHKVRIDRAVAQRAKGCWRSSPARVPPTTLPPLLAPGVPASFQLFSSNVLPQLACRCAKAVPPCPHWLRYMSTRSRRAVAFRWRAQSSRTLVRRLVPPANPCQFPRPTLSQS